MIAAFSTSSPQASVAVFHEDTGRLASREQTAARAASGTCLSMLEACLRELDCSLTDISLFLADLGPGSFTGTRVGVTLAKTLAFAIGGLTGGASAFDLIDPLGTVVLPSKRNEWFVRKPGQTPYRLASRPEKPYTGYGWEEPPQYPQASRFAAILTQVERTQPEMLSPEYLIEPSISLPKRPFGQVGHGN